MASVCSSIINIFILSRLQILNFSPEMSYVSTARAPSAWCLSDSSKFEPQEKDEKLSSWHLVLLVDWPSVLLLPVKGIFLHATVTSRRNGTLRTILPVSYSELPGRNSAAVLTVANWRFGLIFPKANNRNGWSPCQFSTVPMCGSTWTTWTLMSTFSISRNFSRPVC